MLSTSEGEKTLQVYKTPGEQYNHFQGSEDNTTHTAYIEAASLSAILLRIKPRPPLATCRGVFSSLFSM